MVIEGDAMEQFRMVCAITELSLRCNGLRSVQVNMVQFCRNEYGTKGKTNKAVLGEMLAKWEETYGERFELERAYKNAGLPHNEPERTA